MISGVKITSKSLMIDAVSTKSIRIILLWGALTGQLRLTDRRLWEEGRPQRSRTAVSGEAEAAREDLDSVGGETRRPSESSTAKEVILLA